MKALRLGRGRFFVLVLAVLGLMVLLAGCGQSQEGTADEEQADKGTTEPLKIGISQFVEHPALDAARNGFVDELREAGYVEGETVEYIVEYAQADFSVANTVAEKLANEGLDMILAIATPSAQAVAKATQGTDLPVLFTAVTDPVAAELVDSMESPGGNVTGTTDMNPVYEQLELVFEFVKEAKSIGIIYNAGEVNSVVQAEMAKEAGADLGLKILEATVSNTSEVKQAAQSFVGKVDAIYVPTDNTVVSALESVIQVAEENDIPLLVGEGDSVKRGGLATVGLDYYLLGRQTGEMALRILKGEAKPAEMPVEKQKEMKLYLNKKAAEAMGVEIPQDLLEKADELYE